jgi:hypothetical protein
MAEVNEVHEVEVEPRRRSFAFPFIMFLLGGALIAGLVVAFLNVQSTISWPAGQVSLRPNTPVADAGNAASPPPTAVTPAVVAPPTTANQLPTVDTTPPAATTTPPVGDDTQTESSTPPSDSTTPSQNAPE